MKEKEKSQSFWKTPWGNVLGCFLLSFLVQGLLNYDFWNFGVQTLYFGWCPGAYLYRVVLFFVIAPISLWMMIKFFWPDDPEDN